MNQQLLDDIDSVLQNLSSTSPILNSKVDVDKVYEIFVFTCVIRALIQIEAELEPHDINDNVTNNLLFRGSPGYIYAPSSSPGFILINYKDKQYELQNSLQVLGRSKVLHELDVCIIDRDVAVRCRFNSIQPGQSSIKFLAECKFYGNSLPLHLGREFLGLSTEFSVKVKTLISNVESDSIHQLIAKHGLHENFNLSPLANRNVDLFISWLANELRHALG